MRSGRTMFNNFAGVLNSPVLLSDDDGTANGGGAHVTCKDPVSDDELNWGDAAPITGRFSMLQLEVSSNF